MEKYRVQLPTGFTDVMDEIIEKTKTEPKTYGEVIRKCVAIYHHLITNSKDGIITYTNKAGEKINLQLSVLEKEMKNWFDEIIFKAWNNHQKED